MSIKFYVNFRKRKNSKKTEAAIKRRGVSFKGTNGCTVILVHGLTGTPYEMRNLAMFLNARGYSVVCPRLANHGEPVDVLKDTTWEQCYQSIRKAYIDTITANKEEKIFTAGLSVGSFLALLLAEEFKDNISGVSCLAPVLFYDGWNVPWTRHLLPLAYWTPLKDFSYFKEEPPYGIKNEEIRDRVHKYYDKAGIDDIKGMALYGYPYIPVKLLYQGQRLAKHIKKCLPKIKTPVQLVQARHDDMSGVRNSQYIFDNIGSKVKEIVMLENSYHIVTIDEDSEKMSYEIFDFFERIRNDVRNESPRNACV